MPSRVSLHYQPVQISTAPREWVIRTVQYIYDIDGVGAMRQELAAYHWHPSVPDPVYAHCHARTASAQMSRLHLPTRFLTVGAILRWLMRDLDVSPLADEWERALQNVDQTLTASLRWAAPLESA